MKTVAVIGASNNRIKFGNKAIRAFRQAGYDVFPVHPAESEVEGLPCYKRVSDIPVRLNLVSVYVGPSLLLTILPDIAKKSCGELWLNPGTESTEVLENAKKLGLTVVQTCSIRALGFSPAAF